MTGQKGAEFTARYINCFHEMETEQNNQSTIDIPAGKVASYLKAMDRVAVRQNLALHKIAENIKKVLDNYVATYYNEVCSNRREVINCLL